MGMLQKIGLLMKKLKMLNELIDRVDPEYKLSLNVLILKSNYRQIEAFTEFAAEHNFSTINYLLPSENRNDENIINFNRSFIRIIGFQE